MSGIPTPGRPDASDAPAGSVVTTAPKAGITRGLLLIVGIAATLVAALGLKAFQDVVGPLFLAVVLSIIVHPVRRLSSRFHLPGWVGVILSLIAVYCIVAGLVLVLVLSGAQLAVLLEESAPDVQAFAQSAADKLAELGVSQDQLQAIANGLDPGKLIDFTASLLGGLAGVLSSVSFLVLLLFFTVSDAGTFASRLARISPAGQRLASAFELFARGSRQYLGRVNGVRRRSGPA